MLDQDHQVRDINQQQATQILDKHKQHQVTDHKLNPLPVLVVDKSRVALDHLQEDMLEMDPH